MVTLNQMYDAKVGNRAVKLTADYHAGTDTTISLDSVDANIIPSAPNRITVYNYVDEANQNLVTVKYTGITGNMLTGLTVEEADIPASLTATYPIGSAVFRPFCVADMTAFRNNINNLNSDKVEYSALSTSKSMKLGKDATGGTFLESNGATKEYLAFQDATQTLTNKTIVLNDGTPLAPSGSGNTISGIEGTNFKNQGAINVNKVWGITATGETSLLAQSGGSGAVYETGTYDIALNTVTFANTIPSIITQITAGKNVILRIQDNGTTEVSTLDFVYLGKIDDSITSVVSYSFGLVTRGIIQKTITLKSTDTGSTTSITTYTKPDIIYESATLATISSVLTVTFSRNVSDIRADVTAGKTIVLKILDIRQMQQAYKLFYFTASDVTAYPEYKFMHNVGDKYASVTLKSTDIGTKCTNYAETSVTPVDTIYEQGTYDALTIPFASFSRNISAIVTDVVTNGKKIVLELTELDAGTTHIRRYFLSHRSRVISPTDVDTLEYVCMLDNLVESVVTLKSTDTGMMTTNVATRTASGGGLEMVTGEVNGHNVTLSDTVPNIIAKVNAGKNVVLALYEFGYSPEETLYYRLTDVIVESGTPDVYSYVFTTLNGLTETHITLKSTDTGATVGTVYAEFIQSKLGMYTGTAGQYLTKNSAGTDVEFVDPPKGMTVFNGSDTGGGNITFLTPVQDIYAALDAGEDVVLKIFDGTDKDEYYTLDYHTSDSSSMPPEQIYVLSCTRENIKFSITIKSSDTGTTLPGAITTYSVQEDLLSNVTGSGGQVLARNNANNALTFKTMQSDILSTINGTAGQVLCRNSTNDALEFSDTLRIDNEFHAGMERNSLYDLVPDYASRVFLRVRFTQTESPTGNASDNFMVYVNRRDSNAGTMLAFRSDHIEMYHLCIGESTSDWVRLQDDLLTSVTGTAGQVLARNSTNDALQFKTMQEDIFSTISGSAGQVLTRTNVGLSFASLPASVSIETASQVGATPRGLFDKVSDLAQKVFCAVGFTAATSPDGSSSHAYMVIVTRQTISQGMIVAMYNGAVYTAYATTGSAVSQWYCGVLADNITGCKLHKCTKAEYDAITTKDANTLYNITDDSATSDVYTKTESDARYPEKATGTPTVTAMTGWIVYGGITPICGDKYYLNITVVNNTGSAQGSPDLQVATISGNPYDCAVSCACWETVYSSIAKPVMGVIQTKIIKMRSIAGTFPAGAYIPITGVIRWYP